MSPEKASIKLDMSLEQFLIKMREAGYKLV